MYCLLYWSILTWSTLGFSTPELLFSIKKFMKHLSLFLIYLAKMIQWTCKAKHINHLSKVIPRWLLIGFIILCRWLVLLSEAMHTTAWGLQKGCCGELQCLWSWRELHRLWKNYQTGPVAGTDLQSSAGHMHRENAWGWSISSSLLPAQKKGLGFDEDSSFMLSFCNVLSASD